jgi:hypothetical protein
MWHFRPLHLWKGVIFMALKRNPPPGNVRRVISLGNNHRGVTTNKQGHLVQFESEQERKLLLLLERDPTVANYVSQPETLHFQDDSGRQRTYTPDFKVWRTSGHIELHEVTVEARRQDRASLQQREAAARAICQQRGWRYLVHTDRTLPSGYEYANLDFLAAFRAHIYTNPTCTTWWLEQLAGRTRVHPRAVLVQANADSPVGVRLNCLYYLLWHDIVQMDWHRPLIWQGDFHPLAHIWLPPSRTGRGQVQEVRP